MRYLTHYEEYPIYEPAEGGYYYAGNEVVASERFSKRKARAEIKNLWEELQEENEYLTDGEKWILCNDGNKIQRYGYYIGEGESYVIERRQGSEEKGWHPYC